MSRNTASYLADLNRAMALAASSASAMSEPPVACLMAILIMRRMVGLSSTTRY